jgi:transcriptional regulator GlxA family with amidase domain
LTRRATQSPIEPPRTVGFLLLPDLILLSYAASVEPLRAANDMAGRALYEWKHVTLDGAAIRARTGTVIEADYRVGDACKFDLLVIASAGVAAKNPALLAWLRRLARAGTQIAGIAGGVHVMARAGLLDGYRCAVHWAHAAAFREEFPTLTIEPALFVVDRGRLTCSGSGAASDLIHAVIEADYGAALAGAIDEWLLHGPRPQAAPQRLAPHARQKWRSPALQRAVAAMQAALEETLSREELAAEASVSVRQLERLFRQHLGLSIAEYYRDLRLVHAQQLLRWSGASVSEIAIASGFSSPSYFSRAYKAKFGHAPQRERSRERS